LSAANRSFLSCTSRFAVDASGAVAADEAKAWATIAEAAANTGSRALSDPARVLLQTLFEKGDLSDPVLLGVYGRAGDAECPSPVALRTSFAIDVCVAWFVRFGPLCGLAGRRVV